MQRASFCYSLSILSCTVYEIVLASWKTRFIIIFIPCLNVIAWIIYLLKNLKINFYRDKEATKSENCKLLIFIYKSSEFNTCLRATYSSVFSCIDAILQVKRRHNILCIIYYPQTQDQGFLAVSAEVQCEVLLYPCQLCGLRESHGHCRTAGKSLCCFLCLSWDSSFNTHMWQQKHCSQDVE